MKYHLCSLILILLPTALFSSYSSQEPSIQEFVQLFTQSLESRDLTAYLESFPSLNRDLEQARFASMFEDFGMDTIKVFLNSIRPNGVDSAVVYLRVMLQNSFSVVLDLWRLDVSRNEGRWLITTKEILGETKRLFKLALPSSRVERVKEIEINHADIVLTFQNAWVFYDNIPDLETALLIIGDGKLLFSPSLPREQHQLELVYKNRFLEDRLKYAYLRFSHSFFQSNVKIVPDLEFKGSVSESEQNKAYSLFQKHFSRAFTVRSSLNDEFLSILPQGNEAVFEFDGDKIEDTTYVYSPFADDEINFYQWKKERILNLYSPPLEEGGKRLFISFGQKFDVLNYDIELDFDPGKYFFAGKSKIEFETKVGMLDSIKFRLNSSLEILRILDANKRELYFTQDKLRQIFYVYMLDRPVRGERSYIEVFYRGVIEPPQVLADTLSLPQQDRVIRLSPQNFDTNLYSRSSYWYPAPSDNDYFTARLRIMVPPGIQVVSNGDLVGVSKLESLEDAVDVEKLGYSVFSFQTRYPLIYLSFLAGKLTMMDSHDGPIPISYQRSYQSRLDHWDIFEEAGKILNFYQSLFGPFPYEKLSIVKRLWPTFGGHSPASFIVINELPQQMGRDVLPKFDSPVNLSRWKEYFIAHEIAHQWWGQGLGWESYSDQWLSEGIAQFAAVAYIRYRYGEGAFSRIQERFVSEINKHSAWGAITMGTRISHFNFEAYQTIVYNKAAVVLNLLKELLGEESFFMGLQRFFTRHKYSAAATGQFRQVFNEIGEIDLSSFFDYWFNSYLLPDVNVSYSIENLNPGYKINFHFQQLQGEFVFPLLIEWKEDRQRIRKWIVVDKKQVRFEFEAGKKPKNIKVNSDHAVPGNFKFQ